MKNIDSLKLAAKMIYSCEKAESFREEILKFVVDGDEQNLPKINFLLENTDPFLFYKVIALANRIENPFDDSVVKAYWFGNKLLEKVNHEHIRKIASTYHGLDNPLVPFMILTGKKGFEKIILTHLLKLFYWFLFNANDLAKKTEEEIENCRVSFGKVEFINEEYKKVAVSFRPLIFGDEIGLSVKDEKKEFSCGLIVGLRVGDVVACHKGDVIAVLNSFETSDLLKYQQLSLEFINSLKKK